MRSKTFELVKVKARIHTKFMSYLDLALNAAITAGQEILEIYEGEIMVDFKEDKSPLTLADLRSQAAINNILISTNLPILSEESEETPFETRMFWKSYWLIDPLDGTKEFIKKNDQFTVNIALIENGVPILGVVYAPALGNIFWTDKLNYSYEAKISTKNITVKQVFQNAKQIQSSKRSDSYIVLRSLSHSNKEEEISLIKLLEGKSNVNYVEMGSSLKLCFVANGFAQIYPRFGPTMEWDTAAGHVIAQNAGCKIYEMYTNEKLVYNKKSLLNPAFIVEA